MRDKEFRGEGQHPVRSWSGAREEAGHRREGNVCRCTCSLREAWSSRESEEGKERFGKRAAKRTTCRAGRARLGMESQSQGGHQQGARVLDPTRAVGEQKEPVQAGGERARGT